MVVTRRTMLVASALSVLAQRLGPVPAFAQTEDEPGGPLDGSPQLGDPQPFSAADLRARARALAAQDYVEPPTVSDEAAGNLTYDQYRDIRYRPEAAIWRDDALPAEVQLFAAGHVYTGPVRLHLVEDGQAREIAFSPDLFTYGPLVEAPLPAGGVGFSGFRLHGPLNDPDVETGYRDEYAVFQGASYFRAVGAGHGYGLSARGLSIMTAEPEGEEFPAFREFWIETPRADARSVVVHALLDSPSAAGAYRFTIRPGADTVIDVEAALYPRRDIDTLGLATLTSMFFFGPQDRSGVDDFRPAVHDSDGLSIWNGRGEWLWRPLGNPARLEISAFLDANPRGFGLMQRTRDFDAFQDLEARYERRPSLWVEPIGDWGEGSVMLVEIPTDSEVHDNVVAFWRPIEPLAAGSDHMVTYRLTWCGEAPVRPDLARVTRTMAGGPAENGVELPDGSRWFVIDFEGGPLDALAPGTDLNLDLSASAGRLVGGSVHVNPETGGRRVSFGLDPDGAAAADLRCALDRDGERLTEVWVFRWSR